MNELDLIKELNKRLANIQDDVSNEVSDFDMPSTYIVGCPRSGTTALLQYLSSTGTWSYPTNLLTRFVGSIYVGSLVQELLFNPKFGLIKDIDSVGFQSDYGRSKGPLNANEFFHFFRKFFPNKEIRHLSDNECNKVDLSALQKEIRSLIKMVRKPFLSKGLMFQYNLDYFHKYMPNDIFLYIRRDEKYVMQSIYNARIKETGSTDNWWSAKPREYEILSNKTVEEQIAGQVFYTNKAIEKGLELIPEKNKLIVKYEGFINNPQSVIVNLQNKYKRLGVNIKSSFIPDQNYLMNANIISVNQEKIEKMQYHFEQFKAAALDF